MIKSPVAWFGGKFYLVKKLLKLIPKHTTYVEVFGGAGHLLFMKNPSISKLEVYNDIDSGLVNFFRVLRDEEKAKKLIEKVYLTPYSREEYYFCRDTWESCEDDVERAYRWYVVTIMSFSGIFANSWGFSITSDKDVKKWNNKVYKLQEAINRIKLVQIENRDFRDIFKLYDRETTFFYCDPPYVPSTRRSFNDYRYEMSEEDHEELVDILLKLKGKVMLSGYDNGIYKKLEENGWSKLTFETYCYVQNKQGENREKRVECIWVNYDLPQVMNNSLFSGGRHACSKAA